MRHPSGPASAGDAARSWAGLHSLQGQYDAVWRQRDIGGTVDQPVMHGSAQAAIVAVAQQPVKDRSRHALLGIDAGESDILLSRHHCLPGFAVSQVAPDRLPATPSARRNDQLHPVFGR